MARNYVNFARLLEWENSKTSKDDYENLHKDGASNLLQVPPPLPPRAPKGKQSSKRSKSKAEPKCSNFGGIPTLDEQSLSDIDTNDYTYEYLENYHTQADSLAYYSDEDSFVQFSDYSNDSGFDSRNARPGSRLARFQKSISYHSHIFNCGDNYKNKQRGDNDNEEEEFDDDESPTCSDQKGYFPPPAGFRAERKQFKRYSLGCHMMTNKPSRATSRPHSRPDSPDFGGCSTPIAGRLTHEGYSSCEEDEDDDEDGDGDDDVYLDNSVEGVGAAGGCHMSDMGVGSLNLTSRGDDYLGAESSSCSDSLMSHRTSSSRNQSLADYDMQATPYNDKVRSTNVDPLSPDDPWMSRSSFTSQTPSSYSLTSGMTSGFTEGSDKRRVEPRSLFQESHNCSNFGVSCKTGWLEVKHLLTLKKRRLEPVAKRKFRRFWSCLKGTKLLLYTDLNPGNTHGNNMPLYSITLDNCLVQPLPEHPRRENVIIVSTNSGDVYMLQCISYTDMHSWTNNIHKVCGHAVALNKNAEDTVRLLRMDIERKEKMCVEAKSAATVEKYQCDIFRLKCYIASLSNEDMPNSKTLLCRVGKDTKQQLSKINCFSVCAVHALVAAQSLPQPPKPQGSLERPKRTMLSMLRTRESFSSKDDLAKNRSLKRRNSHAGKIAEQHLNNCSSLDDSVVCSPVGKDQLAIWDHQEKGKLGRINLPRNQTTVIPILPNTTVQDVVERCCRKRSLDYKDHFIRVKQFDRWIIPQHKALLANYTCQAVELCIKEYSSFELTKTMPGEHYGFSFEIYADSQHANSRLFVLDVMVDSLAFKAGLVAGDEIIEIDSIPVSSIDQNVMDFHLKKKDSLGLLVRSLRPSKYSDSSCDVCGKRKTSTNDHSASCDVIPFDQSSASGKQNTFQRLAKICDELFSTEKQYICDLETLISDYLTPIIKCQLLENGEIQQLYSAALNIQKVQKAFLHELRSIYPEQDTLENSCSTLEDLVEVLIPYMEALRHHVPFFKVYGSYCALHNTALEIFREASLDPSFKSLLDSRNPLNEQARNLQSFMIKPMQRVLKYKLFIRQIADIYPSDLKGHNVIEETFENVDKLGSHINEMQRVYEDFYPTFEQMLSDSNESYQIKTLPIEELLAHGAVTWVSNAADETSAKKGKSATMMMFVFKRAIMLIPNIREKKRRKMSLVAQVSREESSSKQKFILPTHTTTLVPNDYNDDREQFSLDFTEPHVPVVGLYSVPLQQAQTSVTQRFVIWCKDPDVRQSLQDAIETCCAPSAQMRKRNARKPTRHQLEQHSRIHRERSINASHAQSMTSSHTNASGNNCSRSQTTGAGNNLLLTQHLSRSQSTSPSRNRNTQVDSGVFSDENNENSSHFNNAN